MRITVTGGAGFIGSNLVYALLSGGHDVTVIDDLSTGSPDNLHPAAMFRHLDILSPSLTDAMADASPEAVVHLAAQVDVQSSIDDPERDRAINVDGTRAVAAAAAAAGARRVISASSAAVYGEPEVVPLPETAAKRPENPYGESKLAAETALADALRPAGVDFAAVRFSNVFGPRQDWRGEGGVVAIFAHRLAAGEKPVIYGDGRQTRDFIFVGDVVAALLGAVMHEGVLADEGADGPAYNISTGQETAVMELAMTMRAEMQIMKEFDMQPVRAGDIARSALDPSKAFETFGWAARAPLEVGLKRTIQWFAGQK